MRPQLLDAYWSVVRDGLSCTQMLIVASCGKSANLPLFPLGRPTAFDEFEEFIMVSYVRNMQLMERPLTPKHIGWFSDNFFQNY